MTDAIRIHFSIGFNLCYPKSVLVLTSVEDHERERSRAWCLARLQDLRFCVTRSLIYSRGIVCDRVSDISNAHSSR